MGNRILLVTGNFSPEPTGIGKYSGEMSQWLSDNNYSCTVVTTFPYYPDWKVQKKYSKNRFWYKREIIKSADPNSKPVTVIRCPHYIPGSPTGLKRLLSEITIALSFYFAVVILLFERKYDFVTTIAPPFELGLLGVLYKKIRGSCFLYHIQDLQIDAAQELGMVKSAKALQSLRSIENYILKHADYISTISEGMIGKLRNKTAKDILYFPNWVDTTIFFPILEKSLLKKRFGFEESDKVVLYSGAIGVKQGLESVLTAAQTFTEFKEIKFVICGSGPYKEHLVREKEKLKLSNIVFFPLQERLELNSFLNMADLHLIIQKSNASDLMMPSKLSTILAVGGIAIVTANEGTGLSNIMLSGDMGFLIRPESQLALEDAILRAISTNNTVKSKNARQYAIEHFSKDLVLRNYVNSFANASCDEREVLKKQKSLASP